MLSRILILSLLGALATTTPAAAQKLVMLPVGSWATDVTPDGEVVVGSHDYKDGFIWRWRQDPAPTIIPGGMFEAVSDDGTVVAGNMYDPVVDADVAAIWTEATGWKSLGWLPGAANCPSRSQAYDISGDGSTVVGLSWVNGCQGRGFRWTAATGMQELQHIGTGSNRCSAISDDGSALGGFADATLERSPVYWKPDTSGTALGLTIPGEVAGFNADGSLSVGTIGFSGQKYFRAFVRDNQSGAITNLGSLHGVWGSGAEDISEDGRTIVGFDYLGLARQAWVYTATDGMISLNDRLAAKGVTNAVPLLVCRAVSDDGNVVAGGAEAESGMFGGAGFIAELETSTSPWTSIGTGLAGSSGIPGLAATGDLTPASPTTVTVSKAKPLGSAVLIVGLDAIHKPFKQGVFVPSPDLLLIGLPLDAAGALSLQFPWPAALPGDLSLYWQAWILDAAGPAGLAATPGLRSTSP